jgi:hypothetical protein
MASNITDRILMAVRLHQSKIGSGVANSSVYNAYAY